VTSLRHLSLSSCIMLTDTACSNLTCLVSRLEFLELGGIGSTLTDDGLVRLFRTMPLIRKLDLEDACNITDAVLEALTPVDAEGSTFKTAEKSLRPGQALEHLTVSSATNLTNYAFKALIRGCPRLRVLQADNTTISGSVLKEFVRLACERSMRDAELVVVDCQSVGKLAIEGAVNNMRPRKGWRSWEARKLGYLDGRDEDLNVEQDECDEVIKSFYNWQIVDDVREWRRASKKQNSMDEQLRQLEDVSGLLFGQRRWWMLGSWR
jgi:F-box and leucine-rich repeat protein 2/20